MACFPRGSFLWDHVFSAFQPQFPAWTLGALDFGCDFSELHQQLEQPLRGGTEGQLNPAPSGVTSMANLVPFQYLPGQV